MEVVSSRPFYDEYAWAFDLIVGTPLARQCDFIAVEFLKRGVAKGARILDAGCGVGGHAFELARRGFSVTGVDLSPQLIAEAQRRAAEATLPVTFIVGNILDLGAAGAHDGILCRGVLNDLLDESDRRQVFFSFARALRPDGVLILDVRDWEATARRKTLQPVFEKTAETTRGQLSFRSLTRLDAQTRRLLVAEQHTLRKDGVEKISTYDFQMQCWTQGELQSYLEQAGFEAAEYFGDYDRTVQTSRSDRIVCIATLAKMKE